MGFLGTTERMAATEKQKQIAMVEKTVQTATKKPEITEVKNPKQMAKVERIMTKDLLFNNLKRLTLQNSHGL